MYDILFVQAGGTVDKAYLATESSHGVNFLIGGPAFHAILSRVPDKAFRHRPLLVCQKDSLFMDAMDRVKIRENIERAPEDKVVVTHGTDTILLTAVELSKIEGKTIVLTGAFTPERVRDSDADFNLGTAVAAVQLLPAGVYIALNGAVVPYQDYGK